MSSEYMVLIGVDFGSSTTKVCYRILGGSIDKKAIVRFPQFGDDEHSFLIPSMVYATPDKKYLSIRPFGGCIALKYFKSNLLGAHSDQLKKYSQLLCSFFLAHVLSEAMAYIREKEVKLLADEEPVLMVNVGIPVERDEPTLRQKYEEIIRVAIASCDMDFVLSRVFVSQWNTFFDGHKGHVSRRIYFELHPEILAEVVDVFEDPEMEEGLSMIVDVGSSTMDIAVVDLDRHSFSGIYAVDFVSAKVVKLGVDETIKILKKHSDSLACSFRDVLLLDTYHDDSQRIMRKISTAVHGLENISGTLDKKFFGAIASVYMVAADSSMRNKLNDMSYMPIYFLGGGGCYSWYLHLPKLAYDENKLRNCNLPKFRQMKTLSPLDLQNITEDQYSRFRVAFGLLYPETMLKVTGMPWHFETIRPYMGNVNIHGRLEARLRERYGN